MAQTGRPSDTGQPVSVVSTADITNQYQSDYWVLIETDSHSQTAWVILAALFRDYHQPIQRSLKYVTLETGTFPCFLFLSHVAFKNLFPFCAISILLKHMGEGWPLQAGAGVVTTLS